MRSTRALSALIALLLLPPLAGCSEHASRLTGNERLLRGDQGLGTTLHSDTLVDRDTYVTPATTQVKGATLLVGNAGVYEARALFRPTTWSLPTDTLATIDTLRFRIEFEGRVDENLPAPGTAYSLHLAGAPWDTTNVEWPGPSLGTLLGTGPESVAPFTVDLSAVGVAQIRAWSRDPSFPGFVLSLDSGTGVRGFVAGTGRLEISSHSGTSKITTVVTRMTADLTIHTPALAATGSETALLLGGLFQSEVLLRAPVAPPPAGFSINAARFVARVSSPAVPDTVEVRAYRIRKAWTEGGTVVDSTLGLDAAALEILSAARFVAGDSITIPIPISVAREWSADPAVNQGILLRVTGGIYSPVIQLDSRESANPPVLRVSITSPPPGRF